MVRGVRSFWSAQMNQSLPVSPFIQGKPFVPPDQIQRFGPGQTLHMIHYDHAILGRGRTLSSSTKLFVDNPGRTDLTSMSEPGKFTDFKQFVVYAIGMQMFFTDPQAPPQGAPTAEQLYDLAVYYSRVHIFQQNAEKQILWVDQLPAGGGVTGYSNTANTFHLTNGVPSAHCKFFLKEPMIITPGKSFHLDLRWQSTFTGGFAPYGAFPDALAAFNANTTADKMIRVYLHGIEIRDITNG